MQLKRTPDECGPACSTGGRLMLIVEPSPPAPCGASTDEGAGEPRGPSTPCGAACTPARKGAFFFFPPPSKGYLRMPRSSRSPRHCSIWGLCSSTARWARPDLPVVEVRPDVDEGRWNCPGQALDETPMLVAEDPDPNGLPSVHHRSVSPLGLTPPMGGAIAPAFLERQYVGSGSVAFRLRTLSGGTTAWRPSAVCLQCSTGLAFQLPGFPSQLRLSITKSDLSAFANHFRRQSVRQAGTLNPVALTRQMYRPVSGQSGGGEHRSRASLPAGPAGGRR